MTIEIEVLGGPLESLWNARQTKKTMESLEAHYTKELLNNLLDPGWRAKSPGGYEAWLDGEKVVVTRNGEYPEEAAWQNG